MAAYSTRLRYGAVTQLFHWITAILVLAAYLYGPGGSEQRVYSAAADPARQLHETLGFGVLVLVLLRMLWRTFDAAPDDPPMPAWMHLMARLGHILLYALLLGVPLTAIIGAWLEGHAVTLLGGIYIKPLLAQSHDLGVTTAAIHRWLGDAILWVAGAHAAAALFHHFVLKDRVLRSMLPIPPRE
ncbi:MAG: cytochrome b [Casimicrobiaceae bacterium]